MRTLCTILTLGLVLGACHQGRPIDHLPPIDSTALKNGEARNLDVLKGIGEWRLGTPKAYYKQQQDTCNIETPTEYFHEQTQARLYFKNDTLDAFTLYMHSAHVERLYREICNLYGDPKAPINVQALNDADTTVHFRGLDREPKAYKENIDSIANFVLTAQGSDNNGVEAVRFQYYPEIRFMAKWTAQKALRMTIYRTTQLQPTGPGPMHVAKTDYYVELDFGSKPFSYNKPWDYPNLIADNTSRMPAVAGFSKR